MSSVARRLGRALSSEDEGGMDTPSVHAFALAHLPQDRDVVEGPGEVPLVRLYKVPGFAKARAAPLGNRHVRMEMLRVVRTPGHPGERSKGGDEGLEDAARGIAECHLHEHHVLLEVPKPSDRDRGG